MATDRSAFASDGPSPGAAPTRDTRVHSEVPELLSDYSRYDFRSRWSGRDRVTEVERAVVARAFDGVRLDRVLDIGSSYGRLVGALGSIASHVTVVDLDISALRCMDPREVPVPLTRVAANLFHLPFPSESFSGGAMVRVYHHLAQPEAALSEIARVLRPGGRFLVSYNPTPSVGTIVNDLGLALRNGTHERWFPVTRARRRVAVDHDAFPLFAAPRCDFEGVARSAGLRPVGEFGTGFEEYRVLRRAPAAFFLRLGMGLHRAPGFPARFAVLEKPGRSGPDPEGDAERFACPVCRTPISGWEENHDPVCARCGFRGNGVEGVLDLRYVSPTAEFRGPGSRPSGPPRSQDA